MSQVLVTGGTGFIAGHCIQQLLERNYTVVTTVRSRNKGAKLLESFSHRDQERLTYHIVEDVAQKGAYDEVVKSLPQLDYVIHTTSPFHYNIQDPAKDFLEPAVTGTLGILEAVQKFAPSVKRAVLLSSLAAMRDGPNSNPPFYDETCFSIMTWEEAVQDTRKTYRGSKALSERAAFDFVKREKPSFDLVTINPALVVGPVAPYLSSGDASSVNVSNTLILDMVQGKMKDKLTPTGFYSWVDVRDVAFAHVQALEIPAAGGQRFLLAAGYHTNKRIAQIMSSMGSPFAEMFPSNLDAYEDDLPPPSKRFSFSNQRSIDVLGVDYTSLDRCVRDTAVSMLKIVQ